MLVKRYINNKNYAVEIGNPLYKQGFDTGSGVLEFALMKIKESPNIYDIVEVSTGKTLVPNVGKLKKRAFVNICMLFCLLAGEEIKSRINENVKVEDLPLWKEEDEGSDI